MTVNDLPLLAIALLILAVLLCAGMAWLQTCKGSYRVPFKPTTPPPKKPCGDCHPCKCGSK